MINILDLKNEVIKNHNYVVLLRRYFHTFPEVSLKEVNTSKKIELELDNLLIEHYRIENNIIGIINPQYKKSILLRCDIDALSIKEENDLEFKSINEGIMHACGHDFHIANLLGVSKILQAHKDEIKYKVILVFQSGEEVGGGSKQVIPTNILENVSSTLNIHVCPELRKDQIGLIGGPIRASVDYFRIEVKGKSSHIANPKKGIDASFVASQIVYKAKKLNSLENKNPTSRVLVGIGKIHSGTAYNIISESAVIEGTVRAFSNKKRYDTLEKIKKLALDVASSVNASVNVVIEDYTCPTTNNKRLTNKLIDQAKLVFSEDQIITSLEPELIGDDFGEYALKVPGTYILIGTSDVNKANTCLPLHNCRFDVSEESLINSVLLMSLYVLNK